MARFKGEPPAVSETIEGLGSKIPTIKVKGFGDGAHSAGYL